MKLFGLSRRMSVLLVDRLERTPPIDRLPFDPRCRHCSGVHAAASSGSREQGLQGGGR